jgi:cation:H+ antiporter
VAGARAGAYDLVVGNLLGSNCFNMAALLILDIADGPALVLQQMEPTMQIAALFGILMMGQAILGILHKPQRRVWYLEPHAIFLLITYLAGMYFCYRASQ